MHYYVNDVAYFQIQFTKLMWFLKEVLIHLYSKFALLCLFWCNLASQHNENVFLEI